MSGPEPEASAPQAPASGLEAALAAVGDRWALLIIEALLAAGRSLRFGELHEAVPGIATNVLTQRLRHLEGAQVLVARPYSHRPVRSGYELTGAGRDLADAVRLLTHWGVQRAGRADGEGALGPVGVLHERCGTLLEARWWCPTCDQPVDNAEDGPLRWA